MVPPMTPDDARLARASAATEKIMLGTSSCLVPEHNPIAQAKQIATLDRLSNGRFLFGIGAGWLKDETEIMGGDFEHRWGQTREAILAMKLQGGGVILNTASQFGIAGIEGSIIYPATKAAVIQITKCLALDHAQDGIRVNCICPGVIKTKLSEALWKDAATEMRFAKLKAVGRVGTTDELVGAAIYLASDASSFTTGAMIQVDGGMVI